MGPLLLAMRSLYNWGTSRLGPPDDPEGKELIAFATVGSSTIKLFKAILTQLGYII